MSEFENKQDEVQTWRTGADAANPAGALFSAGEFAAADIVSDNPTVTNSTFTVCGSC